MRDTLIQVSYLIASVLFILGLRSLTRPDRARRGMQMAAFGMLFAIAGTLLNHTIVDYRWIVAGLVIGVVIGYPMGMWVPMTAMPNAPPSSRERSLRADPTPCWADGSASVIALVAGVIASPIPAPSGTRPATISQ